MKITWVPIILFFIMPPEKHKLKILEQWYQIAFFQDSLLQLQHHLQAIHVSALLIKIICSNSGFPIYY